MRPGPVRLVGLDHTRLGGRGRPRRLLRVAHGARGAVRRRPGSRGARSSAYRCCVSLGAGSALRRRRTTRKCSCRAAWAGLPARPCAAANRPPRSSQSCSTTIRGDPLSVGTRPGDGGQARVERGALPQGHLLARRPEGRHGRRPEADEGPTATPEPEPAASAPPTASQASPTCSQPAQGTLADEAAEAGATALSSQ